jgi:hypothetical protein
MEEAKDAILSIHWDGCGWQPELACHNLHQATY